MDNTSNKKKCNLGKTTISEIIEVLKLDNVDNRHQIIYENTYTKSDKYYKNYENTLNGKPK